MQATVDPAATDALAPDRARRVAAARAILIRAAARGRAVFTSSFGLEDMVIGELIVRAQLPIEIVTLDTGRLFPQTLDLIDRARVRWRRPVRVLFPKHEAVEHYVVIHGLNGFRESISQRHHCCEIRKVEPLARALNGADAWVTGLRRAQSDARADLAVERHDTARNLVKVNPLVDWTDEDVKAFIDESGVPINPLHAQGFPSIGCAPCTRAVQPGEPARAGRWWWEQDSPRECGLHVARTANAGLAHSAR